MDVCAVRNKPLTTKQRLKIQQPGCTRLNPWGRGKVLVLRRVWRIEEDNALPISLSLLQSTLSTISSLDNSHPLDALPSVLSSTKSSSRGLQNQAPTFTKSNVFFTNLKHLRF